MKKNAFTMVELIFVIVILGILAAVAVPKFMVTRDDAQIAKIRTDISSIRSAIQNQYTQNLMRGNNEYPSPLDNAGDGENEKLFSNILTYPIYSKDANGHWMKRADGNYSVKVMDQQVVFEYNTSNGSFDCNDVSLNSSQEAKDICTQLTR